MSRSHAPYGMLLDRGLTLEQLDLAYDIAVADPDPKTNRRRLTMALRDIVSEQEAEGKTKKCLTRVWLNPPADAEEMISWAARLGIPQGDRAVLHFGALLATFPFVGAVTRILGHHLQTEGSVDAAVLRGELRRSLGDRSSVDVAARKVYTTLRHLGLIDQIGQVLRPASDVTRAPDELSGWLAHALMLTRQADSLPVSSIRNAPEFLNVADLGGTQRSYGLIEAHAGTDGAVLVRREPPTPIELINVEPDDDYLPQVLALGRSQRKWLGFLPDQGFTDRAVKGTLLAAVIGPTVIGYVLYDLPGDRVKLVHLCVSEAQRGQGTARLLVDEVSARHRDRRGVLLACRRDPANKVWPELGFVARSERPGRSDAGLPLTIWYRDHGHPDLFTYTPGSDPDDRLAVALDANIVIDLLRSRPEAAESLHLEDPWITEYITLCITDEVDQEIDGCDDPSERQRMRGGLPRFRRLASPPSTDGSPWNDLVSVIEEAAPFADPADHRHVARAVAAGASYFVTRDGKLNESAPQLLAAARIEVMRPEELISHVDRLRSQERYEPTALHATSLSIAPALGHETAFVTSFLNYADGERKTQLESTLRTALADPRGYDSVVVTAGPSGIIGGVIRQCRDDLIAVDTIRVAGTDRTSYAVARQLAYLQRQLAASTGTPRVLVTDKHPSTAVRYALALEGYHETSEGWISHVSTGIYSIDEMAIDQLPQDLEPTAAAGLLEHERWPLKVTDADVPTFIVPIRPQWAQQLFDSTLAAGTLFGRDVGLGLSREHVYYRKPRNANGIAPPARILWYVSGRTAGQTEGSIRAVSQLAEVVVGRPLTVHQRFSRLGVYTESQVKESADSEGLVMALRFTDPELFAKPVGLSEVRSMSERQNQTFVAPMSPRRVDEDLFIQIYRQASAYAG